MTARGIGLRALILLLGLLLLGFWAVSLAFKLVGAAIHLVLWLALALIAVGAIAVVRHKLRR
ncbi:MAG TPA: hypothetical protein VEO54_11420 [Thermoanaerobaculia bacterium]|nr:hypothetical protein [Thermoanaerobaculia bacterium]